MRADVRKSSVLTAAMCQGNMLEPIRDEFPDRFFDTGICESHTVAFAAGLAKAGMRPIVDVYSTFLQRAYDQVFQEVALQNLPVVFTMDRAGLTGPDGPTHHGVFDLVYMRVFPNLVVMAPGDAQDVAKMLDFALRHDAPCAIRYPKASVSRIQREVAEVQLGRAEVLRWGADGVILCCGALLHDCVQAANTLRQQGLNIGVVNARFAKPVDHEIVSRAIRECRFRHDGRGGDAAGRVRQRRAGGRVQPTGSIPAGSCDWGFRTSSSSMASGPELLADLQLDAPGIAHACREMAQRVRPTSAPSRCQRRAAAWTSPAMNDPQPISPGDEARTPPWSAVQDRRLRVLLLGNGQRPHVHAEAERLRPIIEQHAEIVLCDFAAQENLQAVTADFAVVLGWRRVDSACRPADGFRPAPDLGCESGEIGVSGCSGSRRVRPRVSRRVCAGSAGLWST